MIEVVCRRRAMATLFECVLVGDDAEHLNAVGEAALDRVERLEQLLSCHDATSELSRVNRSAGKPVKVSVELLFALRSCALLHQRTGKRFNPCYESGRPFAESVAIDAHQYFVTVARDCHIDLGGFGKGYALDAIASILDEYALNHWLIHGGTSSAMARGTRADGRPWLVELRGTGERIELKGALSVSGDDAGNHCAVFADCATVAEAWSTALLVERSDIPPELSAVAWVARDQMVWLKS